METPTDSRHVKGMGGCQHKSEVRSRIELCACTRPEDLPEHASIGVPIDLGPPPRPSETGNRPLLLPIDTGLDFETLARVIYTDETHGDTTVMMLIGDHLREAAVAWIAEHPEWTRP